jgi:hypothetical protein
LLEAVTEEIVADALKNPSLSLSSAPIAAHPSQDHHSATEVRLSEMNAADGSDYIGRLKNEEAVIPGDPSIAAIVGPIDMSRFYWKTDRRNMVRMNPWAAHDRMKETMF